jgi:CRISPR-associated protein Csm5
MRYGHLETVNVILRTLSPVFIGSGQHFGKKEYILDVQRELISFLICQK